MDGIAVDDAAWPLVTMRWQGSVTDGAVAEFLVQMDRWLDRGERFGLLLDTRGSRGLTPDQRGVLLAYMKRRADATHRLLVQAVVIDNQIIRALYAAFNWIFPMRFVTSTFSDPDTARTWLLAQLSATPTPASR